jgi:hypothetical protein
MRPKLATGRSESTTWRRRSSVLPGAENESSGGSSGLTTELALYQAQADRDHQAAFRKAGLGTVRDRPASLAAVIRASAVRGALVAALDDWAVCSTDCCNQPTSSQP